MKTNNLILEISIDFSQNYQFIKRHILCHQLLIEFAIIKNKLQVER
jgi:hypothetical protein